MNGLSKNPYFGKRVAVLGMGRSGLAAARLLKKYGADVTVCDSMNSAVLTQRAGKLCEQGLRVLTGPAADKDPSGYELAILSPGIEESTALVRNIILKGVPLIGELELAYSLCKCPVIAITGSNGKTTTTELTTLMMRQAGLIVSSCGNIGIPMSEVLLSDEFRDALVVEVSSFQLETIKTFRPKVAAWLNLSPNHLDRYRSLKEYRDAKLRIFENQSEKDTAILPHGEEFPGLKARRITFSTTDPSADLTMLGNSILHQGEAILDLGETKLNGTHNAANLMAAFGSVFAVAGRIPVTGPDIKNYHPPAHRCELIAEFSGVRWINDSKATNLDAMVQAIRSVKGPLVLIAGGKDKGFGFSPVAALVRERVDFAILIGEMRHRIASEWSGIPISTVESLEEAVMLASQHTVSKPQCTVLLSPGTSSFDMFSDYIERGERFRKLVQKHLKEAGMNGQGSLPETKSASNK